MAIKDKQKHNLFIKGKIMKNIKKIGLALILISSILITVLIWMQDKAISMIPGTPHDFNNRNLIACLGCHSFHFSEQGMAGIDSSRVFWPGKVLDTDSEKTIQTVCWGCHGPGGVPDGVTAFQQQGWTKGQNCKKCHTSGEIAVFEQLGFNTTFVPPNIKDKFLRTYSHHPIDTDSTIGLLGNTNHSCIGCHTPHGAWDSGYTYYGKKDTYPYPKLLRVKVTDTSSARGYRGYVFGTEKFCFTCHDLLFPNMKDPANIAFCSNPSCHITGQPSISDLGNGYYNSSHVYKYTSHTERDMTNDFTDSPTYEVGPTLTQQYMWHKKRRRSDYYLGSAHKFMNRLNNPYRSGIRTDGKIDSSDISCLICHEIHGGSKDPRSNNLMRGIETPDGYKAYSQNTLCYQCHDAQWHYDSIVVNPNFTYRYYRWQTTGQASGTYGTDYIIPLSPKPHRADKAGNRKGHGAQLVIDYIKGQTSDTAGIIFSEGVPCSKCHEPHGTGQEKMIKVITQDVHRNEDDGPSTGHPTGGLYITTRIYPNYSTVSVNKYNTTFFNNFCYGCHTSPAFSTVAVYSDAGPTYIDWKTGSAATGLFYSGKSKFDSSSHKNAKNIYESMFGRPSAGCRACHEPHGTDYPATTLKFEEKLCFDCHQYGISNHKISFKELYESVSAIMERSDRKAGSMHTVFDSFQTGFLTGPVNRKVECTNCHNTHTANRQYPLMDPDSPKDIFNTTTLRSANSFCFKCHGGDRANPYVQGAGAIPFPGYRLFGYKYGDTLSIAKITQAGTPDIRLRDITQQNAGAWGYLYNNPSFGQGRGDSDNNYGHLTIDATALDGIEGIGEPNKILCIDCHEIHASSNIRLIKDVPFRYSRNPFGAATMNYGYDSTSDSTVTRAFCFSCHVFGVNEGGSGSIVYYYNNAKKVDPYKSAKGYIISTPNNDTTGYGGIKKGGWLARELSRPSVGTGYVLQHETTGQVKDWLCINCHLPHNPRPVYTSRCLTDGRENDIGYRGCHSSTDAVTQGPTGNPYSSTYNEFFAPQFISQHSVKYDTTGQSSLGSYGSYIDNECAKCHAVGSLYDNLGAGAGTNYGHNNHGINYNSIISSRGASPVVRDANAKNNFIFYGFKEFLKPFEVNYTYSNEFCLDCHSNAKYDDHDAFPYTYGAPPGGSLASETNTDPEWPKFSGPKASIDTNGDGLIDKNSMYASELISGYERQYGTTYRVIYRLDKAWSYYGGGHGNKVWESTKEMKSFIGEGNIRSDTTTFDKVSTWDEDILDVPGGKGVLCFDCHEQHGSRLPKNLRIIETSSIKINRIIGMNNEYFCYQCHATRFDNNRLPLWPGEMIYESSVHGYGIQYDGGVPAPSGGAWDSTLHGNRGPAATNIAKGTCTNCHDPHGKGWRDDNLDGRADSTYPSMLEEPEERVCYICHSNKNTPAPNLWTGLGYKTVVEVQNAFPGKNRAKNMKIQFDMPQYYNTASAHNIYNNDTSKIECTDCHNPHSMKRKNKIVAWGESTVMSNLSKNYWNLDIDSTARAVGFCIQCHGNDTNSDGYPDSTGAWGPRIAIARNDLRPVNKRVKFWNVFRGGVAQWVWDKSTHGNVAQGNLSRRKYQGTNGVYPGPDGEPGYNWGAVAEIFCIYCHDPHGSRNEKLIRTEFGTGITKKPVNLGYPMRKEDICFLCHDDSGKYDSSIVEVDTPIDLKSAYYFETTYNDINPYTGTGYGGIYFDSSDLMQKILGYKRRQTTRGHHLVLWFEQNDNRDEKEDIGEVKLSCYNCHDHHKASYSDNSTPSDSTSSLYACTDPYYPHDPMKADVFFCLRCHDRDTVKADVKGTLTFAKTDILSNYIPITDPSVPGSTQDPLRWKTIAGGVGGGLKNIRQLGTLANNPAYVTGKGPFYNNPKGTIVGNPGDERTKFISGHAIQAIGISVDCIFCHDQHGSEYGKVLRDKTNKDANQRPLGAPWQSTNIMNMLRVNLDDKDNDKIIDSDPNKAGGSDNLPQSVKTERCLGCHSGGTMYWDSDSTKYRPIPIVPPGYRDGFLGVKGAFPEYNAHGMVRHPLFDIPGRDTTDANEFAWIRANTYSKPIYLYYNMDSGMTTRKEDISSVYATKRVLRWDSLSVKGKSGWGCQCHASHNPYIRATDAGYVYACFDCHGKEVTGGIPATQLEFEGPSSNIYKVKSKHPIKYYIKGYESAREADPLNDGRAPLYIECLKCHLQMKPEAAITPEDPNIELYHMEERVHLVNPLLADTTKKFEDGKWQYMQLREWYPTNTVGNWIKKARDFYDLTDTEFDSVSSYNMPAINNFCLHCHYIKGFQPGGIFYNGMTEAEERSRYDNSPLYTRGDSTMVKFTGKDADGYWGIYSPPQLPDSTLLGVHFNLVPGNSRTDGRFGANLYNNNHGLTCTDCHEQHGSPARGLRQQFAEKNGDSTLPYYYLLRKHIDSKDYNLDGKKTRSWPINDDDDVLDDAGYCNFCHGNNLVADRTNDYGKKEVGPTTLIDPVGPVEAGYYDTMNLFSKLNGGVGRHHAISLKDRRGEDTYYGSWTGGTKYSGRYLSRWDSSDDAQVDCTDCHNVHVVQRGKKLVTANLDSTPVWQYAIDYDNEFGQGRPDSMFCMECHGTKTPDPKGTRVERKSKDKATAVFDVLQVIDPYTSELTYETSYIGLIKFPAFPLGANTGVEWDNGKWNKWNKEAFESTGHRRRKDKYGYYYLRPYSVSCADCHDPHGSSNYRMLKEFPINRFQVLRGAPTIIMNTQGVKNIRLETTRIYDPRLLSTYPGIPRDYPGYESSYTKGIRKRYEIGEKSNEFCFGCHYYFETTIPEFPGRAEYVVRDFGTTTVEYDPANGRGTDLGKRKLCLYCHNPHGTKIQNATTYNERTKSVTVGGPKIVEKLLRHDRPVDMRRENPLIPGYANPRFGFELKNPNTPPAYTGLEYDSTPQNLSIGRVGTPFARRGGYVFCNNSWCHPSENVLPNNFITSTLQNQVFNNNLYANDNVSKLRRTLRDGPNYREKTLFDGFDLDQGRLTWGGTWDTAGSGTYSTNNEYVVSGAKGRVTSWHPLKDDRMFCVSCHYPHGSPAKVVKFVYPAEDYRRKTSPMGAINDYYFMNGSGFAKDNPDLRAPYYRNKYWPYMFMNGEYYSGARSTLAQAYADTASYFITNQYLPNASGNQTWYDYRTGARPWKYLQKYWGTVGQNLIALQSGASFSWNGVTYYRINPPDDANDFCYLCHREQDIIGVDPMTMGQYGQYYQTAGMTNSNTRFRGHETVKGGARISKNIAPRNSAVTFAGDGKFVGVNNEVHLFSCSRCHRPHSTRNEKLLATRCFGDKKTRNSEYTGGASGRPYGSGSYYNYGDRGLPPYWGNPSDGDRDPSYDTQYGVALCHPYANGAGWPPLSPNFIGWRNVFMPKYYFIRNQPVTQLIAWGEETRGGNTNNLYEGYFNSTSLFTLDIGMPAVPRIRHAQNDVLITWKMDTTTDPKFKTLFYTMYLITDKKINDYDPVSTGLTQTYVRYADRAQMYDTGLIRLRPRITPGFDTAGGYAFFWMPYGDIYGEIRDRQKLWIGITALNASGNESMLDWKRTSVDSTSLNVPDTTPPLPWYDSSFSRRWDTTIFYTGVRYEYIKGHSYYDTVNARGYKVEQRPGWRDVEFFFFDPGDNGDIGRYEIWCKYESTANRGILFNSTYRIQWNDVDRAISYFPGTDAAHTSTLYNKHNPNSISGQNLMQFVRDTSTLGQYWTFTMKAFDSTNNYSSTKILYRIINPRPETPVIYKVDMDTNAGNNSWPFNMTGRSRIAIEWKLPYDDANDFGDPKYGGSVVKYNIYRKKNTTSALNLFVGLPQQADLRATIKFGGRKGTRYTMYSYESTVFQRFDSAASGDAFGYIRFVDCIPNIDDRVNGFTTPTDLSLYYHYVMVAIDDRDNKSDQSNEITDMLMPKGVQSTWTLNPLWPGKFADSKIDVNFPGLGSSTWGGVGYLNETFIKWRRDWTTGIYDTIHISEAWGLDSTTFEPKGAILGNTSFASGYLDSSRTTFSLKDRRPGTYVIALWEQYSYSYSTQTVIGLLRGRVYIPATVGSYTKAQIEDGRYTCYVRLRNSLGTVIQITKIPNFRSGDYYFFENVIQAAGGDYYYQIDAWIDIDPPYSSGSAYMTTGIYTGGGAGRGIWRPDPGDVYSAPIFIYVTSTGTWFTNYLVDFDGNDIRSTVTWSVQP